MTIGQAGLPANTTGNRPGKNRTWEVNEIQGNWPDGSHAYKIIWSASYSACSQPRAERITDSIL